jgi:hypothetical protein
MAANAAVNTRRKPAKRDAVPFGTLSAIYRNCKNAADDVRVSMQSAHLESRGAPAMKRFVLAAAIFGLAAFTAQSAEAGHPHRNLYVAGHHHHGHHHARYYGPPVVQYYRPPVRCYAPVVVVPPVYAPPVVYGSYYRPWNSLSFGGRNFDVQFAW